MKKLLVLICLVATIPLTTGNALAESIKGRVGVTGKIGMLVPADSDYNDKRIKPDIGFVGGGGLIYGIDNNFAAELDVTRTEYGSDFPRGGNAGDFGITNVSLGGQYRFEISQKKLVPYIGAGFDILLCDFDLPGGFKRDVDTTVGVHASGGIDYFYLRHLAFMAELKAVAAPDTDIRDGFGKQGNFNPSSISGTVGVRYFFN